MCLEMHEMKDKNRNKEKDRKLYAKTTVDERRSKTMGFKELLTVVEFCC